MARPATKPVLPFRFVVSDPEAKVLRYTVEFLPGCDRARAVRLQQHFTHQWKSTMSEENCLKFEVLYDAGFDTRGRKFAWYGGGHVYDRDTALFIACDLRTLANLQAGKLVRVTYSKGTIRHLSDAWRALTLPDRNLKDR